MATETKADVARPVKRVVDVHIEVTPPRYAYGFSRKPEDVARSLREWSKDLVDFIRDHRSQDAIELSVIEDTQDVCSACGREWEEVPPDADTPHTTCAWCGAIVGEVIS